MRAKNVEPNNPTALLVTGPAEQESPLQIQSKLLLRVEPKNPTSLFLTGPAEQQSPLKNLVKLLLMVLPDGFEVTWWGWCPQRTLKEIENEKNRTKATAVKNALV